MSTSFDTIEILGIHDQDYGVFHALALHGELLVEANRYLIWKKDHGGRGGRRLSTGSLRQYAYHLKYLFDIVLRSEPKRDWTELTIHDLISIRDRMDRGENSIDRGLINLRTAIWADFFFWCRNNGIDHDVHIKTLEVPSYWYADDDFLAHVPKESRIVRTELWLPPIDRSRVYRVLSRDTWKKLAEALREIDPVYEAVAVVMINTGLRINGALQLKKTSFLPYPELDPEIELDFDYVPKGQMDSGFTYKCVFPIDTWGWLHEKYMPVRRRRAKLHRKRYGSYTHAMFLKETGEVVKDFDVWKAFRKASEHLGKRIVPHMLRHTFATWTVMVWAEEEGVRPTTESFYKHIHDMLAEQLGHKRISTTKKYCRTASFLAFRKIMPKVTEKSLGKPHIERAFSSLKAYGFDTGL